MTCPECLTEDNKKIEMEEIDSNSILVSTGNYENEPDWKTEWIRYGCPVCGYEETVYPKN